MLVGDKLTLKFFKLLISMFFFVFFLDASYANSVFIQCRPPHTLFVPANDARSNSCRMCTKIPRVGILSWLNLWILADIFMIVLFQQHWLLHIDSRLWVGIHSQLPSNWISPSSDTTASLCGKYVSKKTEERKKLRLVPFQCGNFDTYFDIWYFIYELEVK